MIAEPTLARPARPPLPGTAPPGPIEQILRFAAIGVASTLAYVAIYALIRSALPAAGASAFALVVTAIGNTAANRRLTFGVRGGHGMLRHHAAGLIAFGLALALTTVSIGLLDALDPGASRIVEVGVLVAANALATGLRFLVLRRAIAGAPPPDA